MPINFVTGLPRQGKTLFTFVHVQERAKRENRPVYYCNIPEVTIDGWQQIDHPDKWLDLPNDAIIIVDELQDFWGMSSSGARVPFPILELSKHGKRGMDFYFITQDPTLVHATPRKLCEVHFHVVRAFGSNNAMVHKFNRMQTDPEKVKAKAEAIPWRYPKDAFGKKDKAGNWIKKPWYKSADVHNIKRQIPLKVWAIPGVLVLAALAVWAGVALFSGTLQRVKNQGTASVPGLPLTSAPGQAPGLPGPAGAPGQTTASMTPAQYLAARQPRIPDFPHTAPVYDAVTQPTEAPYPAACVTMSGNCRCYTQQATLMHVSNENCMQIVKYGFFMDWKKPEQTREVRNDEKRHQVQKEKIVSVPMPEPTKEQPGFITQADIPSALALRKPSMAAYASR